MNSDAVTFTYSGVLNKGNRKFICVRFERSRGTQKDYAEGEIPKCEITKQQGFSEEELQLFRDMTDRILHNVSQKEDSHL